MGLDATFGASALESAGVGVALSQDAMLACRAGGRRRHKTSVAWVRQMMKQVRRSGGARLYGFTEEDFTRADAAAAQRRQNGTTGHVEGL
jgi:hypothetical protein